MRKSGLLGAILLFVALGGAFSLKSAPPAQAVGPGMDLSGPNAVLVGSTFTMSIKTNPAPSQPLAGFATEVLRPPELPWLQRAQCDGIQGEVKVTVGGGPPGYCLRGEDPLDGSVKHAAISGTLPPMPPLDTLPNTLVQFDLQCSVAGTYTLVLAEFANASNGAAYYGIDFDVIDVSTITYNGEDVADTHQVTCLAPGLDADLDGCTNAKELGTIQAQGGKRDPLNFWDFFDTPNTSNARDKAISQPDITRVQQRFGATDTGPGTFNRFSDPLSMPNAFVSGANRQNYHPAFDRGPAVPGGDAWDLTAADGAIAAADYTRALAQWGHNCVSPP